MRSNQVLRAQRAIDQFPDNRAAKRELANGNPYMLRWLERQGDTVTGSPERGYTIGKRIR